MPATKKKVSEELIHGIKPHRPKRGEPYMGDVQTDHFRQILNAWKQELVDDIERTMSVMQDETINLPDPNDRATLETDRSLELRTRDRERKLIKKINDSLADIDKGDYGLIPTEKDYDHFGMIAARGEAENNIINNPVNILPVTNPNAHDFTISISCQTARFLKYSSDAALPVFNGKKFFITRPSVYRWLLIHPFLLPLSDPLLRMEYQSDPSYKKNKECSLYHHLLFYNYEFVLLI